MRNRVKLAVAYIRFYKKQAAVLFLGISMSVLLFTGIASLLHSNQYADYQNAREEFGDWAYRINVSDARDHGRELGNNWETSQNKKRQEDVSGMNQSGKQQEYFALDGEGYQLTKEGYFASCVYPNEKQDILLCYGDETYLEQTGRSLLEGRYPEQEGEIALDYYALHNLDVDSSLGSVLMLGKQSYILTGIFSEGASGQNDSIMIFLADGARQNLEMQSYCYLTFSEDSRAYEQFSAFLGENRIREAEWEMNDGLAPYIGAEPQESIVTVIRTAWHLQNGKLIYLLGTLENSRNLLSKTLLWILFLFSVFIIASILQVILEKRIRQYGIMEVLGMTGKDQWMSLWLELIFLFIPAYIVGSVAGNALAAAIYRGKFIVDQSVLFIGLILDGEIRLGKMLQENQVVLKTLMDGAGYYDGIDIQPGDHITLKVPKTEFIHTEADLLKFQSEENHYIEQEFEVAAVVSRCVGENDVFIGSGTGVVSVIMPQQMMEEHFGISDYNSVNFKLDKTVQSEKMVQELRPYFQGLSSCVLHDYSGGIKRKNQILMQKVYFFYGISVILFLISLLHAINSMKHLIWSRRYEFGVLRAMGITDAGFRGMLVRQGAFYGITSSIVMLVLTVLCQGVLAAIMQHVIRYIIISTGISLVACIAMALWNTVVCILAMVCCGQELLREHVVDEIRG